MAHSEHAGAAELPESQHLAEVSDHSATIGYENIVIQPASETRRSNVNRSPAKPGVNTRLPGWHT